MRQGSCILLYCLSLQKHTEKYAEEAYLYVHNIVPSFWGQFSPSPKSGCSFPIKGLGSLGSAPKICWLVSFCLFGATFTVTCLSPKLPNATYELANVWWKWLLVLKSCVIWNYLLFQMTFLLAQRAAKVTNTDRVCTNTKSTSVARRPDSLAPTAPTSQNRNLLSRPTSFFSMELVIFDSRMFSIFRNHRSCSFGRSINFF